ncbi:MAG: hypothetical protein IT165_15735 [Bryobacterales bacterium]|nr:hypothetical protein [Bryobacterales bacterium]
METRNDISLALEKHLQPVIGLPSETTAQPALHISVILTSFEAAVVIGGRRRLWPREESRLARQLRRAGHSAILTEME